MTDNIPPPKVPIDHLEYMETWLHLSPASGLPPEERLVQIQEAWAIHVGRVDQVWGLGARAFSRSEFIEMITAFINDDEGGLRK